MHPQIRRNGPGQCPICGMALEPLEPSLDDGPNPELVDMSRRFWVSAVLSVPLVVLAMGAELFGWELLPMRTGIWVQLAVGTPIVLWGGWPFFERFWASLRTRRARPSGPFLVLPPRPLDSLPPTGPRRMSPSIASMWETF